jgi:hypothetical protein
LYLRVRRPCKIARGAKKLRRRDGEWNSMKSESKYKMNFSLDFFLEEPYI